MKSQIWKGALLLCAGIATASAEAQSLRSAYFLDGYLYRHQMNPAFEGERAYFSFPALGNLQGGACGNVGISDFLYPYDDPTGKSSLTTFMNSSVSQSEFLNNLHDNNYLNSRLDMTLLSVGFRSFGGYSTFGIALRSDVRLNLPYDLFDFMKSGELGGVRKQYYLHDMQMSTQNYVDISLGHSHDINDRLRIGATLKLLIGAGYAKAHFDQMDVTMSQDEWLINANGYLEAGVKGSYFTYKENGEIDQVKVKNPGIGGWGAAVDLGASYQLMDNLSLSASVTDLGFLKWKNALRGITNNEPYSFKGFEVIGVGSDSKNPSLEDQLDEVGDDLSDLAKFYDGGTSSVNQMLGATIHVGAEYELPAYRNLSFGLLSTTYVNKPYTWTEARASVNIAPLSWFDAALTGGVSTYGPNWGFVVNIHPKGFNFFFGTDMCIMRVTPQYIPSNNMNANFCMGLNFTVGSKNETRH